MNNQKPILHAILFIASLVAFGVATGSVFAATLESELSSLPTSDIVRQARVLGDPRRGAAVFFRQEIGCTQCHQNGDSAKLLGPDLSALGDRATYTHVIESILQPSKAVGDGYKAERFLLANGNLLSGMVREESESALVIFVPGEEQPRTVLRSDIDDRLPSNSIMPTGLINQLGDEQEFYDLVSYVVEIGETGAKDVEYLKPDDSLLRPAPLPEYENELDHAGMIQAWDLRSRDRGEQLYSNLCVNCHGTQSEPGSLPNALRFASEKFKNGSDPYSLYKTITHGYKMMLPQRSLVPQQKYDVIHYIREAFLKPHNPTQYTHIDAAYLAGLPSGKLRGPAPVQNEPWSEMDYGPFLISTYEVAGPDTAPRAGISKEENQRAAREGRPPRETWPANTNFAYKGIAIRLDEGSGGVAAGSHWIAFEHDTMRIAGAWSGRGFIDWRGILFNGNHVVTPRTIGDLHFGSLPGPGWADPATGSFEDPRLRGKDGRAYGPLPRSWAQYKGTYKHGDRIIISYTVGDANVLEAHAIETLGETTTWTRALNVGKSTRDLTLRVAPDSVSAMVDQDELVVEQELGYNVVRIPAQRTPINFAAKITSASVPAVSIESKAAAEDLNLLTRGGPAQWPQVLQTIPQVGNSDGPFAIDTLSRPVDNPWKSRLRMSGLDFFEDGQRLVACCCDGDVWIVNRIDTLSDSLEWKRIASGLFQPLGIKIVNGRIFVTCRDQIVILNDLNGDGETDFYECFNNDHQVTDHFHEFAMGLQADADGNFYYAKSARHARDSLVPQHGTLLKVSADGSETTILANGFRAANGVCLNPDGSFFVTDQEGHWNPMNRINRVVEGGFYGNMYSYGAPEDSSDVAMEQPLCWPNKLFDRSPSELLWVNSPEWGPLAGSLLNLSYGYGKVYIVPFEKLGNSWQGGMCRLPLPQFPTGVMRARFHAGNGQMYACGMNAWGSDQEEHSGGLYRVRYTGAESMLPIGLAATTQGITIKFTQAVDPKWASDPENYLVETWALKRSANYGSQLYDVKSLAIETAEVVEDGDSISLRIPDIKPTWCMQISYKLKSRSGKTFTGTIQNTIHELARPTLAP